MKAQLFEKNLFFETTDTDSYEGTQTKQLNYPPRNPRDIITPTAIAIENQEVPTVRLMM